MSLVTRCPSCGTAFRVLLAQLSARAGRVRCGKCGEVFDGVAALVEHGDFDPSRRPPAPLKRPPEDEEPLPAFMAEAPAPPRRALWWSLTILAALALIAQATYHFRSEIAVAVPGARAPLDAACRWLRCEVPLPRLLKLLSIDSYEVRADPRREGVIVLNAVIKNRAPFRQEHPALQFTLTDEANRQLASRSIWPREYLDAGRGSQLIAQGIDAGGEASLTLYFDAGRSRATGYELVLFYPS
jgi:predicted Zn finger-like uncharacterized protein